MSAVKRYHEACHDFQRRCVTTWKTLDDMLPGFWAHEPSATLDAQMIQHELNELEKLADAESGHYPPDCGPYLWAHRDCRKLAETLFPFWFRTEY